MIGHLVVKSRRTAILDKEVDVSLAVIELIPNHSQRITAAVAKKQSPK